MFNVCCGGKNNRFKIFWGNRFVFRVGHFGLLHLPPQGVCLAALLSAIHFYYQSPDRVVVNCVGREALKLLSKSHAFSGPVCWAMTFTSVLQPPPPPVLGEIKVQRGQEQEKSSLPRWEWTLLRSFTLNSRLFFFFPFGDTQAQFTMVTLPARTKRGSLSTVPRENMVKFLEVEPRKFATPSPKLRPPRVLNFMLVHTQPPAVCLITI